MPENIDEIPKTERITFPEGAIERMLAKKQEKIGDEVKEAAEVKNTPEEVSEKSKA